jgi:NADH:ubiquinone oxidoreductase subunit K
MLPDEPERDSAPPPLEYFAANEPERVRARGLNFWAIVLIIAWVPYVCGIVNASTVMRSYSPPIIAQHRNGAMLFMGLGLLLASASLIGFVRQRHAWGVASAAVVILVQLTLTACAGLAAR